MNETFETINAWQRQTFPDATPGGCFTHLKEECEEFLEAVSGDGDPVEEATDLIITAIHYLGKDAQRHIDAKMAINRSRGWRVLKDGTGRHE